MASKYFSGKYLASWIAVAIFGLIVTVGEIHSTRNENDIKANMVLTSAVITKAHYEYKAGTHLDYEIVVNGVKYSNHTLCHCLFCPYGNFVGKRLPVVYSSKDPSHLEMLVYPKDFEEYGMQFPDSLQWVLQIKE